MLSTQQQRASHAGSGDCAAGDALPPWSPSPSDAQPRNFNLLCPPLPPLPPLPPSLPPLPPAGELRKAGVNVFGMASRKESVILHVKVGRCGWGCWRWRGTREPLWAGRRRGCGRCSKGSAALPRIEVRCNGVARRPRRAGMHALQRAPPHPANLHPSIRTSLPAGLHFRHVMSLPHRSFVCRAWPASWAGSSWVQSRWRARCWGSAAGSSGPTCKKQWWRGSATQVSGRLFVAPRCAPRVGGRAGSGQARGALGSDPASRMQ